MTTKPEQPETMTPDEFTAGRARLKLSKTALAERLGMSRKQITRYEAGEYEIPTVAVLALRYLLTQSQAA